MVDSAFSIKDDCNFCLPLYGIEPLVIHNNSAHSLFTSKWDICKELCLRELEEVKARAAQMEKTEMVVRLQWQLEGKVEQNQSWKEQCQGGRKATENKIRDGNDRTESAEKEAETDTSEAAFWSLCLLGTGAS